MPEGKCDKKKKPCCIVWDYRGEDLFRTACGHCGWIYSEWRSLDLEGDERRTQLSQTAYREQHEENGCPGLKRSRRYFWEDILDRCW
jgi:hypothetical protein